MKRSLIQTLREILGGSYDESVIDIATRRMTQLESNANEVLKLYKSLMPNPDETPVDCAIRRMKEIDDLKLIIQNQSVSINTFVERDGRLLTELGTIKKFTKYLLRDV